MVNPTSVSEPDLTTQSKIRSDAIDVLKGLGIFFVVLNHCFARGSRKFLGIPVTDDFWLYAVNRTIHFAVPMFLFVSSLLLAQSLSRTWNPARYFYARWRKTAIPYLVASVAYSALFSGFPWNSADGWNRLGVQILTGKASFHLYFTVVLIQASVAIPLLVLWVGKKRFPWAAAFVVGVGLQVLIYWAQRQWLHWERPGSIILWYAVPLLLGLSIGLDPGAKASVRACRKWILLLVITSGFAYVATSVSVFSGRSASSDSINVAYAIYTGSLALWLWTLADKYPSGIARSMLNGLGRASLPLFLIHPAVMYALGGPKITAIIQSLPAPLFVFWLLTLFISFVLAKGILLTRVGRWVLGESFQLKRKNPTEMN